MFTPATRIDARTLLEAGSGLGHLELKARQLVDGFLAGGHRGPRRGAAAEFAEHRPYAPGDDLRDLDWKVFGKHDRFYLRQREQDTNFTCHLLLDASPSMRFCSESAPLTKLEAGCLTTAAVAWLALRRQDPAGVTTFAQSCQTLVPPSGHPSHLTQIAAALEQLAAQPAPDAAGSPSPPLATGIRHPLHGWAEQNVRRGVVVVISDFLGDLSLILTALRHIRSRRHDVLLLHVVDPAEENFPFDEPTLFHDLESPTAQPVDCRQVRAAYRAEFDGFCRRLEGETRESGMDYARLRTDQPLDRALAAYLSQRTATGG